MSTISKKELLTPDVLRLVCEVLNKEPEAIGKHSLEVLACFQTNEKR